MLSMLDFGFEQLGQHVPPDDNEKQSNAAYVKKEVKERIYR